MRHGQGRWHINKGHTATWLVDLDPMPDFQATAAAPSPLSIATLCTFHSVSRPHGAKCWSPGHHLSGLYTFENVLISYWEDLTHPSRLGSIKSINSPWTAVWGSLPSGYPFISPLIPLAVSSPFQPCRGCVSLGFWCLVLCWSKCLAEWFAPNYIN